MSSSGKGAANGEEETRSDGEHDGSSTGKVDDGAAEESGTPQDGKSGGETPDGEDEEVGRRRPEGKQPARSRSFNDRHVKKQSARSAADEQSSAADEKLRKPGALPKYDLTFRCTERAEKRKEFFSKLEGKIQAKEVEKSTLEAKAKEKEEAEIKTLRKSLIFKANPLPSFYQEPPPPKPKLKKIPTTKPRSPKLSKGRTSATSDSEDHSCCTAHSSRLSLDSKMAKSRTLGGASPVQEKQSVRKSLPKPPSEKTSSAVQEKSSPAAESGASDQAPELEERSSS
uniref:TPX2 C-terminal domain-containing protein n=1 Tax=Kalanchoe fedtschenkoi TaxID=63787 RepID=A0A7N0UR22_KALFE